MADTNESLGERIRRVRLAQRLSTNQYAEKLSVDPSHLSQWQNGKRNVPLKHAAMFSSELNMTTEEVIKHIMDWKTARKVRSLTTAPNAIANIFPLMKATCDALKDTADPTLTMEDIVFLLETQEKLKSTMSPETIAGLLKNRKG